MRKLIAILSVVMMLFVALPAQADVIESINLSGKACPYGQDVHYIVKANRPIYKLYWQVKGSDFNAQGPWNNTSNTVFFNPAMPVGNYYDIDTGRQYVIQDANQNGVSAYFSGWGGSPDVVSLFSKYCGA